MYRGIAVVFVGGYFNVHAGEEDTIVLAFRYYLRSSVPVDM
jgi:hypothetical protein